MQSNNSPGFLSSQEVLPPRVEELSRTAVPVFMGYVAQATADQIGGLTFIERYADYERLFCLPGQSSDGFTGLPSGNANTGGEAGPFLRRSLYLYFLNGGGPCFVFVTGLLSAERPPLASDFQQAMEVIDRNESITLILPTDAIMLPADQYFQFCRACLAYCAGRHNRFCMLDAGSSAGMGYAHAVDFAAALRTQHLHVGAAYYPPLYLQGMGGPVSSADGPAAAQGQWVLPSAAAAAAFAVTDRTRGVWKAPANVAIDGVLGVAAKLSLAEMGELYLPANGKSVNLVRSIHGRGIYLWGARTLAGHDPDWQYINVRRLVNFVQASLRNRTLFAAFEPNGMRTWIVVKGICDAFLRGLWESGGLAGTDPPSAFEVAVGLGQSMTQAEIDAGQLVVQVRIAVKRPAEFITLKIFHQVQALGNQ